MTDNYTYRPNAVQAFQYQGEHVSVLPDWIKNYTLKAPGPYGNNAVGTSIVHDLLIPTRVGVITVQKGHWIILEDGALYAVTDVAFHKMFEPQASPTAKSSGTVSAPPEPAKTA